jgi:5-methylcytosine-specific restriction enzyme subunit McrC
MLLYAWQGQRFQSMVRRGVEDAPTLQALLATVLVDLLNQRFRIGLGREYIDTQEAIKGLRGRVDLERSLRERRFDRGEAVCRFTTYDHDAPRNRIIKSGLERLILKGDFGSDPKAATALRARLRRAHRDMEGVRSFDATVEDIRRIHLGPNDGDYRLMLNMCEFILASLMPTQAPGTAPVRSWVQKGMHPLAKLFEDFVPAFLRRHLNGWKVSTQTRWQWPATSTRLPIMIPDVLLERSSDGQRIILDTKFSKKALSSAHGGAATFESSHLYQLYAYLRTQEDISTMHATARGILLYPSTGVPLREQFVVQGHDFTIATIDLTQRWPEIEAEILSVVDPSPSGIAAA